MADYTTTVWGWDGAGKREDQRSLLLMIRYIWVPVQFQLASANGGKLISNVLRQNENQLNGLLTIRKTFNGIRFP